jgi:hypothetical protein
MWIGADSLPWFSHPIWRSTFYFTLRPYYTEKWATDGLCRFEFRQMIEKQHRRCIVPCSPEKR